ncbi:MAG: gamma-glutamyl-gamma-aminobutyrate hydrolase family protein [Alkalimonas sp.]|nr:gamma-glutamyl-gamma-aminobutyrate hydrolase family protein [Alkalimonas sp.]
MARPVIAITGPERGAFGPRFCVALAVRCYGGIPLQLRPSQRHSQHAFDGVVVTGGHDVDPVLYAAEPEVHPRYDQERDKLEMAIIKQALDKRLPLLGICRGAQLLNVSRGGNLWQHLKDHRANTSHRWTVLPLKTLCLEKTESMLSRLLQSERCKINSLHNQAINEVGKDLQVVARDLDDIVQAVEDPNFDYLLGVQWHPEFLLFLSRQRRLFKALIEAARQQLATR